MPTAYKCYYLIEGIFALEFKCHSITGPILDIQ